MIKKNIILTSVFSVLALAILIMSIIIIKQQEKAKDSGNIIVDVISIEGMEIKKKNIEFYTGDTLKELIEKNFDGVKFEDSGYGPFLLEIEGYKTPSDWSSYISIYVDGQYSEKGIASIEFKDGTYISFRIETYNG